MMTLPEEAQNTSITGGRQVKQLQVHLMAAWVVLATMQLTIKTKK